MKWVRSFNGAICLATDDDPLPAICVLVDNLHKESDRRKWTCHCAFLKAKRGTFVGIDLTGKWLLRANGFDGNNVSVECSHVLRQDTELRLLYVSIRPKVADIPHPKVIITFEQVTEDKIHIFDSEAELDAFITKVGVPVVVSHESVEDAMFEAFSPGGKHDVN